jgi:glucose-1-phosphate thymidylyltransferase
VQLRDGLVRGDLGPLLEELQRDALDALLLLDSAENGGQGTAGIEDKRLLRLAGDPPGPGRLAGVHVLGPKVMRAARVGGSLLELMSRVLADGGRARTRRFDGSWRPVAQDEELLEANRVVLDDLHPGPCQGTLTGSRIQGRVVIGPGTRLESTLVRGPAVIGSRVRLKHAYIGPYSSIGDDVEIEGAEVEHSVVLPGAVIKHLGVRLEASVVGRGAKVFRDFTLPRALRLRIADGDEVCLA